jgi:hypothetical protein
VPALLPSLAVLAYTFGLGLVTAAVVVWVFVWILVAVRVVRRHDLDVGGKLLWILVILVLPILGLLVYFLWDAARPRRA